MFLFFSWTFQSIPLPTCGLSRTGLGSSLGPFRKAEKIAEDLHLRKIPRSQGWFRSELLEENRELLEESEIAALGKEFKLGTKLAE